MWVWPGGCFGRDAGGAHSKHLPLQKAVNFAENRLKRFALRRHLLHPELPRQLRVEGHVCCAVCVALFRQGEPETSASS